MQYHKYTVTVLRDIDLTAAHRYGIFGIPITFFIDANGIIKYVKRGPFLSQAEIQVDLNKISPTATS